MLSAETGEPMFRIDLECRCGHRWRNYGASSDMEQYKRLKADRELECPNCDGNRVRMEITQLFEEPDEIEEEGFYYDDKGVRHACNEVPF